MSKIKLIGIDLDGTAFNSEKEITKANLDAFKRCRENNIHVVPVTGRPFSGLYEEHKRKILCEYSIHTNGAAAYRLSDNKRIITHGMDHKTSLELIDILDGFDCYYGIFFDGFGYLEEETLEKELRKWSGTPLFDYVKRTRKPIKDRREFLKTLRLCDNIYAIAESTPEREKIKKAISHIDNIYFTSSIEVDVEIGGNCSKGSSLIELGSMLGIERSQIMAIGDSGNDLKMLEAAGVAVAMDNSSEEIKQAADFVTKSCEESGVAYAIDKLVFNK
ncbi:MAG: Cof-type HAD-IIB family hydrolase [Ruminococcus sp.]|nr:Cof-type HAD-IIB family hydrolase [Ruminococcus sp.]